MALQHTDRGTFAAMLSAVAAIYGREMSPQVIAIYWAALSAYDLPAVRQALDRHVKNPDSGQFMPKPADVIRMLGGSTQDAALVAWAKVERAIRTVGGYASVVFDDPLIHAVLDEMGGWVRLCDTRTDELPFRAKEFENRYRGFALRREVPPYRARLAGRAETANAALGYDELDLVLIGDEAACRRVMAGAVARTGALTHVRDLRLEVAHA